MAAAAKKELAKEYFFMIAGTLLYAAGLNIFIVPLRLYNGGATGVAQIIRTILIDYMHVVVPEWIDLAGGITLALNIPLLILAYRNLGRKFFFRTLVCTVASSFFLTVITVHSKPLIEDYLTACIIGGIIAGFGTGVTLRSGGAGGGTDIIGLLVSQKNPNASVGKITILVNLFVFGACAVLFNFQVVVYSIIYNAVGSFTLDKVHYQNIKISATIITKSDEIAPLILTRLDRGVTKSTGCGAYTGEPVNILITVISKYEIHDLNKLIAEIDPHAFIIFNESTAVKGNFIKKF